MRILVRLHKEYYNVLTMFGPLDDVVDSILDACSVGAISAMDKPSVPSREGTQKYYVNVSNEDYLNLVKLYGINNQRISLRRLLYWFVDMEVWNELDFTPDKITTDKIIEREREEKIQMLNTMIENVNTLSKYKTSKEWKEKCENLCTIILQMLDLL